MSKIINNDWEEFNIGQVLTYIPLIEDDHANPSIKKIELLKDNFLIKLTLVKEINSEDKEIINRLGQTILEKCPELKILILSDGISVTNFNVINFEEFLVIIQENYNNFASISSQVKHIFFLNRFNLIPDEVINFFRECFSVWGSLFVSIYRPLVPRLSVIISSLWGRFPLQNHNPQVNLHQPHDGQEDEQIAAQFFMNALHQHFFKPAKPYISAGKNVDRINALKFNDDSERARFEDEIPEEYLCPISKDIMTDPIYHEKCPQIVIDRSSLENWKEDKNNADKHPVTRSVLTEKYLWWPKPDLQEKINKFVTIAEKESELNNGSLSRKWGCQIL